MPGNASFRGCPHGRRGEETQADSSQIGGRAARKETEAEVHGDAVVPPGSKKKPAAFCRNTTLLMGIIIKQCLRTEQDTRSLLRSHLRHSHHVYGARRREEHEGTDASVQRGSPGSWQMPHTGPPQIWAWRGLIAGLQKQGEAVGAANAATLTGYLKQLDGMSMDTKCDHARFCRARSDVPIRTSSHFSVGRQVRRSRPSRERAAAAGSSTQDGSCLANSNSGWTPNSTSRK